MKYRQKTSCLKISLIILTFIVGLLPICAQEYKTRADLLHDMEWGDTDVVIMNGEIYLINKSFLINFKGYKNIFPEIPKVEEMRLSGDISSDYDMPYRPFWVIDNDSIYLVGIGLNGDSYSPDYEPIHRFDLPKERFRRVERLVGKQFKKGLISEKLYTNILEPVFSDGVILGTWINGVYYIKPIFDNVKNSFTKEFFEKWKKAPILKLTIQDGKIIKTEKV